MTPGWERFEASLWRTTSLLVVAEGESLVVDPAISADEVAGKRRRALERVLGSARPDHSRGLGPRLRIGGFPDAVVAMGRRRERGWRAGAMTRQTGSRACTGSWPGRPSRPDVHERARRSSWARSSSRRSRSSGHTDDGTGYRIREPGLLIVGDHLSGEEFPFAKSPAAYRFALAGLIETLREDPPKPVIPGHGPSLRSQAKRCASPRLTSPTYAPRRLSSRRGRPRGGATPPDQP